MNAYYVQISFDASFKLIISSHEKRSDQSHDSRLCVHYSTRDSTLFNYVYLVKHHSTTVTNQTIL